MFVNSPNIPNGRVTVAAISQNADKYRKKLEELSVKLIDITPHKWLDNAICSHADMLLHHLGENRVIIAQKGACYEKELVKNGFQVSYTAQELENKYPKDILLNAARLGNKLICSKKNIDESLTRYCGENNIEIIDVNQGYARCSCCIVNENAVITADSAIYNACQSHNIDALKISAGNIVLKGYNYGFIGGACGLIDKNLMAFCGNIALHPDGEKIAEFLRFHGVDYISLSDGELEDIGGILPLKQADLP